MLTSMAGSALLFGVSVAPRRGMALAAACAPRSDALRRHRRGVAGEKSDVLFRARAWQSNANARAAV